MTFELSVTDWLAHAFSDVFLLLKFEFGFGFLKFLSLVGVYKVVTSCAGIVEKTARFVMIVPVVVELGLT